MGEQTGLARWPLTERDRELSAFTSAWAAAGCTGAFIWGPAGVGKSRLAEECLAQAVRQGWRPLRATASAAAGAVPLGAIAHLLPPEVDLTDPVKGFAQVAAALAGPERKRRWAVWVDDVHLLDATSAMLLRQLMDAAVVRLIGTVRAGEPPVDAVDTLSGGDSVLRIDLTAFDRAQARAVLEAALGGPVGRHTLHEFHTASGGNALYLRELVAGALQSGALRYGDDLWELTEGRTLGTQKLTELIQARLNGAGPQARPLLELLALCGPVSLADAEQHCTAAVLAELQDAGLIESRTDRRRVTLALSHPLYGEMLRDRISVLRRRSLLMSQAERTSAAGARRRDDALHLAVWRLAATGSAEPALLVQAAALARQAHDYQQVVTLLEALPDRHHTTRSRLLYGECLTELGNWDQAEGIFAEADAKAVGDAEIVAVTISRTFNLFWLAGRTDEALVVNDAARRRLATPASRRALDVNEGSMYAVSGRPTRAVTLLNALEPDVHQAADVTAWLLGAIFRPAALAMVGRTAEAVAAAEAAYTTHLASNDIALAPHAASHLTSLVLALAEAGELDRARSTGEQAFGDLLNARAPVPRVWTAINLARAEWLAGRVGDARRWYAEAATLARIHRQPRALAPALTGLISTTALLGDLDAAARIQRQRDDVRSSAQPQLFVGEERLADVWLHAARGQLAQARAILTEAAESARAAGHLASEALLLTDLARLGGAAGCADRLAELAARCDGAFAPARAGFAAALAADDPERLVRAAGELEAVGAHLLAAEAATVAAEGFRRAGYPRRAAAAQQTAQGYAAGCQGARTPLLTSTEAAAALTPREREIALLAATGHASKDIAETLHLSVRTVNNHLQHAYAKLGVTTRRELAGALGVSPTGVRGG
ncbi:LuxR C-terminal-related transcriptional regulator [Streptomyces sp. NPDC048514]|uniref:LuxR C-terminal-related transcriptional regulator n=1 Tax=Streptomyces sp. NPDC048514 TaxID=3365564 RepID=UPI0037150DAA